MLRTFLCIFSGTIFVATAISTIFLTGISQTYFNPDFYNQEVITDIHNQSTRAATEEIIERTPEITETFDRQTIENAIIKNFPPDLLKQTISSTLRQIKSSNNELNINLEPYHSGLENVVTDLGTNFLKKTPTCTTSENKDSINLKRLPSCITRSTDVDEINNIISAELDRNVTSNIPPSIGISQESSPILQAIATDFLGLTIKLTGSISLFLILVIIFATFPKHRKTTLTLSITLGITGLTSFILALILPKIIVNNIQTANPDYSNSLITLINTLILYPTEAITRTSSIVFAIGVVFMIISFITKPKPIEPKITTSKTKKVSKAPAKRIQSKTKK